MVAHANGSINEIERQSGDLLVATKQTAQHTTPHKHINTKCQILYVRMRIRIKVENRVHTIHRSSENTSSTHSTIIIIAHTPLYPSSSVSPSAICYRANNKNSTIQTIARISESACEGGKWTLYMEAIQASERTSKQALNVYARSYRKVCTWFVVWQHHINEEEDKTKRKAIPLQMILKRTYGIFVRKMNIYNTFYKYT